MKRILRTLSLILALTILTACGSQFTFVQMTDTQIGFQERKTPHYPVSTKNLKTAVEKINAIRPDIVFNTGDLVDDPHIQEELDIYRNGIAALDPGIRYQELIGNHDSRPALFDFDHFSFVHKKCAFIGINTNIIKDSDPRADRQFEWLKGELEKARRNHCRHIFVFTHCPLFRTDPGEADDYFNFPAPLRERYTSLFSEYGVDAVFSGHLHYSSEGRSGNTLYLTTGSVSLPIGNGRSCFRTVRVGRKGFDTELVNL